MARFHKSVCWRHTDDGHDPMEYYVHLITKVQQLASAPQVLNVQVVIMHSHPKGPSTGRTFSD